VQRHNRFFVRGYQCAVLGQQHADPASDAADPNVKTPCRIVFITLQLQLCQ
jgi:hypothetical protein